MSKTTHVWRTFALASVVALCAAGVRAEVTIVEPWVRGMVPGQSITGAFATIKSTEAVKLIDASSPVAQRVEVHRMAMDQGVLRMRPMDEVDIPAHGAVEFKPGTLHVMLIGVDKPLVNGQKVPLTLVFQNKDGKKTSAEIQAEVRALN